MTNEQAIAAADSLSDIQNSFWNCPDIERFETYMDRIAKRYSYIKDDTIIGTAYAFFLERQRTCPRTLSNGDFMEFNAVTDRGIVYIVDWGFGGIMPYSLDIARFIAFLLLSNPKDLFYIIYIIFNKFRCIPIEFYDSIAYFIVQCFVDCIYLYS